MEDDLRAHRHPDLSRMSLPIFVSCIPALSDHRDTGTVLASTVGAGVSPRRASVRSWSAYQWDPLYHRMRQSPVGGNR